MGIFSGTRARNSFYGAGPDLTIDLRQFEIPVWIENELLFNRESNPTGFGKRFEWWGGFSQLYLALPKHVVAYARYDWIEGDHFNDTALGGVTGPVSPREWDAVVGIQWYVLENLRIGPEYLYRKSTNDGGRPGPTLAPELSSPRALLPTRPPRPYWARHCADLRHGEGAPHRTNWPMFPTALVTGSGAQT